MNGKDLKRWMEANEKTVIDVASLIKVHPQTVQRFLDGKRKSHPITVDAFKRLTSENTNANSGGLKATG